MANVHDDDEQARAPKVTREQRREEAGRCLERDVLLRNLSCLRRAATAAVGSMQGSGGGGVQGRGWLASADGRAPAPEALIALLLAQPSAARRRR